MLSHSSRHTRQLFPSWKISSTDPTAALSTLSLSACAVYVVIACIMAGGGNQTVNEELEIVMMMEKEDLIRRGVHLCIFSIEWIQPSISSNHIWFVRLFVLFCSLAIVITHGRESILLFEYHQCSYLLWPQIVIFGSRWLITAQVQKK